MFRKNIPNLIALGAIGYHHSSNQSVHMEESVHPVIIVGSGPAAHTAAIYSARANLNPGIILQILMN
jgi:alkyl hydroperoxide reductase subunit AhpF